MKACSGQVRYFSVFEEAAIKLYKAKHWNITLRTTGYKVQSLMDYADCSSIQHEQNFGFWYSGFTALHKWICANVHLISTNDTEYQVLLGIFELLFSGIIWKYLVALWPQIFRNFCSCLYFIWTIYISYFKQELHFSTDTDQGVLGSIWHWMAINPFICSVNLVDYENICGADKQTLACSSIHSVCTFFQITEKGCELRC